jgi:hypothetical protein
LSELAENGFGYMPQAAGDSVAFHSRPHRLADHQPDSWRRSFAHAATPPKVNNDIRLRRANPVLHRRVKVN